MPVFSLIALFRPACPPPPPLVNLSLLLGGLKYNGSSKSWVECKGRHYLPYTLPLCPSSCRGPILQLLGRVYAGERSWDGGECFSSVDVREKLPRQPGNICCSCLFPHLLKPALPSAPWMTPPGQPCPVVVTDQADLGPQASCCPCKPRGLTEPWRGWCWLTQAGSLLWDLGMVHVFGGGIDWRMFSCVTRKHIPLGAFSICAGSERWWWVFRCWRNAEGPGLGLAGSLGPL